VRIELPGALLSRVVGRRTAAILAGCVGVGALVATLNGTHDAVLFHHFALSRSILARGFLRGDDPILLPGAYPGGPFPYWLASLALYAAELLGGRGAVILLAALALAAAADFVWADALDGEVPATWLDVAVAVPILILILAVLRERSGPRPEVLAAALVAATALAARRYSDGRGREVLLFPVVAAAWANVDGSVVLGLAVPLVFAAEGALRAWFGGTGPTPLRRAAVLAALTLSGLAATFLGPWPGAALSTSSSLLGGLDGSRIHDLGWRDVTVFVTTFAALGLAGRRTRPADVGLAMMGLVLGLAAPSRGHFAAILLAPVAIRALRAAAGSARNAARPAVTALAATAAAAAALATVPGVELRLAPHLEREPVRATDVLGLSGFRGGLYAAPEFGSYLAWHLDVRSSADLRPGDWGARARGLTFSDLGVPDGGFAALVLPYGDPGGDCLPERSVDPAVFALVAYDDAAALYVRRDGPLGMLGTKEFRVAVPCHEISVAELTDAMWLLSFRAEAARAAADSPQCLSCKVAEELALAAGGRLSSEFTETRHPAALQYRQAGLRLSASIAGVASEQLARGEIPRAISTAWLAMGAGETASAHVVLALAFARIAEPAAAVEHARHALALDPRSPEVRAAFEVALAAGRTADGAERARRDVGPAEAP
jgi:hypothetical protein